MDNTITFTIPVTKESIGFIKQSLQQAASQGFDTSRYMKQIEIAELNFEIADKEAEVVVLKEALAEKVDNDE